MTRARSIRKEILFWLVPALFLLWISSAFLTYWLITGFSREAFDRELLNAADSIVGRVRIKDRSITVDLPPAALAILKYDNTDEFFYRIIDDAGNVVSGDPNLPALSHPLRNDIPVVSSIDLNGKSCRLAELKMEVEEHPDRTVVVQVAETTRSRDKIRQKILFAIAGLQLLTIALGLGAVLVGVRRGLAPVELLRGHIQKRTKSDLSPVPTLDVPEEVDSLVLALNQLLERLKEEMESHERLLADAAHQLRTPLAGLKTYSSIGVQMEEKEDMQHVLAQLDLGIDRASRMVNQLLALERMVSVGAKAEPEKENVDLEDLARDVLEELEPRIAEKDLRAGIAGDSLTIPGDFAGLRHLLFNLVENAIAYTPAGGEITITLCAEPPGLTVEDTGEGIQEDQREKVFDRFYRIDPSKGIGSGLGLSIVKEVARAHSATVTIAAGEGGKGTRVVVSFG
ncbi:MAG: sensor histidine kinase N-terminal domain-containing protein [Cyanobacteria bacterium HKST-UBA02]|nr:sensor histidine kinase N-terminal domain-containing protein [Cyanobacteria bacterium HKST-UBA02]